MAAMTSFHANCAAVLSAAT